ncbi:phosphoadenylyl-sulfate reductase [Effusibacillus pohliae]|uniref:phosphoadenylyl-sulfate reductase n=1 Tax=Effusibacillus pohliae TaxID=232270 RepID=UPI0003749094|nr:phosphoadenylyl-sulfate reductase [Effusibacillus pohliae]
MIEQRELVLSPEKVRELNDQMEDWAPQEILRFALETIDNIAFACSFGAEDVALIDMIVNIRPDTRIFYLDTDVLFPETYDVRDRIVEKYNPNLIRYSPLLTLEEQAEQYGEALWASDPNTCCNIRKVEPLKRALAGLDAWITGIRREQAPTRANAGVIEVDQKFGLIKVNPLARWTHKQVWKYIMENQVPYNVLHDQGYPSIGCMHCTRPVKPGEDPRAGRWSGFNKTECGLHQ